MLVAEKPLRGKRVCLVDSRSRRFVLTCIVCIGESSFTILVLEEVFKESEDTGNNGIGCRCFLDSEATVVTCFDATGRKEESGLGKVLPGQQDGALLWYRDITGLLKNKLGMEEVAACPCLLRAPYGPALVLHMWMTWEITLSLSCSCCQC